MKVSFVLSLIAVLLFVSCGILTDDPSTTDNSNVDTTTIDTTIDTSNIDTTTDTSTFNILANTKWTLRESNYYKIIGTDTIADSSNPYSFYSDEDLLIFDANTFNYHAYKYYIESDEYIWYHFNISSPYSIENDIIHGTAFEADISSDGFYFTTSFKLLGSNLELTFYVIENVSGVVNTIIDKHEFAPYSGDVPSSYMLLYPLVTQEKFYTVTNN